MSMHLSRICDALQVCLGSRASVINSGVETRDKKGKSTFQKPQVSLRLWAPLTRFNQHALSDTSHILGAQESRPVKAASVKEATD